MKLNCQARRARRLREAAQKYTDATYNMERRISLFAFLRPAVGRDKVAIETVSRRSGSARRTVEENYERANNVFF